MNAIAKNGTEERALAHAARPPAEAAQEPRTFVDLLESSSWRQKIAEKLPASMTIERLKGIAITAMNRQPKLLRCTPMSWYQALTECATTDLWPGPQGHAYLVPYNNKKKGPDGKDAVVNGRNVWEDCVQFQLGYRGMIELAYRSGVIEPGSFQASAVYANDDFDFGYGTESFIKHKPKLLGERGDLIGFYVVCRPKGMRPVFDVMRKDEVDAVRDRSKSANAGPWVTDYSAMGVKTVLRRFWKMLPSTVTDKYADLIERDAAVEFDLLPAPTGKPAQREKRASVTGEIKTKKPEWSPEELQRQGRLTAAIYAFGERAEAECLALYRRMRYDEPSDTLDALDDLLEKWQGDGQTQPEQPAESAPSGSATLEDARALIKRMTAEIGDDRIDAILGPILDEFAVEKLPDLNPALFGEFIEKAQDAYDIATGRAPASKEMDQ